MVCCSRQERNIGYLAVLTVLCISYFSSYRTNISFIFAWTQIQTGSLNEWEAFVFHLDWPLFYTIEQIRVLVTWAFLWASQISGSDPWVQSWRHCTNKHMVVLLACYCHDWEADNFGSLQLRLGWMSTFCLGLLMAQRSSHFLCQEYFFLLFYLNERSIEISITFRERSYMIWFLQHREGKGAEVEALDILSCPCSLTQNSHFCLFWCTFLFCSCNSGCSHLKVGLNCNTERVWCIWLERLQRPESLCTAISVVKEAALSS